MNPQTVVVKAGGAFGYFCMTALGIAVGAALGAAVAKNNELEERIRVVEDELRLRHR